MVIEINVPDIGADELEVTEILVSAGDKVEAEQSLIIVEGDKVSMEIPSPHAGIVKELKISVGDKVNTGKLIMIFESAEDSDKKSDYAPQQKDNAIEVSTKSFDYIDKNIKNNVCEINNKSTAAFIGPLSESSEEEKNELAKSDICTHATPIIRRMARKLGINLAKVKGTGRKGRILREDIQAYVVEAIKHADTAIAANSSNYHMPDIMPWPIVDFSKFGDTEEVDLGRIQKISGANLYRNWLMIPHVTHFDEADITELEAFRKQQNDEAEKKKLNVKITPLGFIIKVVAKALEELPIFNSSLSNDAQKLTIKKYINIGIAVDTPNGLVVPVLRDVNKKGILELSCELSEISKKARSGKLTSFDMQGGSFTISSLGSIGGTAFTPIVNAPEVAILGVSKKTMKPIWNGKDFSPRLMLPLALSYDHRVIDGAAGARFINFINKVLSDIRRLVM